MSSDLMQISPNKQKGRAWSGGEKKRCKNKRRWSSWELIMSKGGERKSERGRKRWTQQNHQC